MKTKLSKSTLSGLSKKNLRLFGQGVMVEDVAIEINAILGETHELYQSDQVDEVACAIVYLHAFDKDSYYINELDNANEKDWLTILKAINFKHGVESGVESGVYIHK